MVEAEISNMYIILIKVKELIEKDKKSEALRVLKTQFSPLYAKLYNINEALVEGSLSYYFDFARNKFTNSCAFPVLDEFDVGFTKEEIKSFFNEACSALRMINEKIK
ncbi:MAG: hypothetical protein PF569_05185 [Candidatus Woesearchaeota archaeon]|jgi:ATP sulfurylase|nr:hypothetical protein [Candidatus Woesearchaeota archaeon]